MTEHEPQPEPNEHDPELLKRAGRLDRKIRQAFADISPEQFLRETSAISEADLKPFEVIQPFADFGDLCIRQTHIGFIASQGELRPFAVLENSRVQRLFAADDDETFPAFGARLQREAQQMNARRFYICGTVEATRAGGDEPEPAIFYFAASREGGQVKQTLSSSGVIFYEGMALERALASKLTNVEIFTAVLA